MKTRLMLELGCNHQGDFDIATKMIAKAAELGVYGVKLQKRCLDEIPESIRNKPRDPSTSFGDTYYEHRKALEFSDNELLGLKDYAEKLGLVFSLSVFDLCSAKKAVEELGVRCVKIPSQHLLREDVNVYLKYVYNTYRLFTVRSTGMHTVNEVHLALLQYRHFDVTMYCRSVYPLAFTDLDVGAAIDIYSRLNMSERGYSSHDKDGVAILQMLTLGATWIERHFTLDKSMKGSDHHTVSSDPEDIRVLIRQIELVESTLTPKNMNELILKEERANADFYRRRA